MGEGRLLEELGIRGSMDDAIASREDGSKSI